MSDATPDVTAPGGQWATMRLIHPAPSLAQVRWWVRRALADETTFSSEAVVQVVNSLVSNAYRHTSAPRATTLIRHRTSPYVRIEVEDGERTAALVPTAPVRFHLGLRLVAGLSTAWGVRARHNGKVVWADVTRTGPVRIPVQRG
ncbi:ATP-binding protein [Lentzea chajnantorensis]